jgi:hypothetical protein
MTATRAGNDVAVAIKADQAASRQAGMRVVIKVSLLSGAVCVRRGHCRYRARDHHHREVAGFVFTAACETCVAICECLLGRGLTVTHLRPAICLLGSRRRLRQPLLLLPQDLTYTVPAARGNRRQFALLLRDVSACFEPFQMAALVRHCDSAGQQRQGLTRALRHDMPGCMVQPQRLPSRGGRCYMSCWLRMSLCQPGPSHIDSSRNPLRLAACL